MAMTDSDKLALTLALCGIDATDESSTTDVALVESAYLPSARDAILAARNPFSADPTAEEWEPRFDRLQCEAAAELYARRGAEGEVTHNENGVNRTWGSAGISKHLMQRVVPRGKVPA